MTDSNCGHGSAPDDDRLKPGEVLVLTRPIGATSRLWLMPVRGNAGRRLVVRLGVREFVLDRYGAELVREAIDMWLHCDAATTGSDDYPADDGSADPPECRRV